MNELIYILIDTLKFGIPYSILALGIFISYRLLDFADLSTEGTFTLGGVIIAVCLAHKVDPFLATLLVILSGFIAGFFTGLLHTKLHIPSLLSGIIIMTALFSLNMVILGIADGSSFATFFNLSEFKSIFDSFLAFFNKPNYNMIFISLIIVIIVMILLYYFFGNEIGMSIRATGMNKKMASSNGINTSIMMMVGLGISNALISLSGSLFAQISGSASNVMGVGVLVIGLASIMIGEAIFGKRTFKNWLISVSLGAIIYYLIIVIALRLGLPDYYLKLLYASLIVVILTVPYLKGGRKHVKN